MKESRAGYMRAYRAQKKLLQTPVTLITKRVNINPSKAFNYEKAVLIFAIITVSFFLICEQVSFYVGCGYSYAYAIFLSLLLEMLALIVCYFASARKKPFLNLAAIPAVLCAAIVIFLGLLSRSEGLQKISQNHNLLTKQIQMLESQAVKHEGKKLDGIQGKILQKTEELRSLPKESHAEAELAVFALIRFFAFVYNLIFARLLAT